jgi:hypothetical protein
MAPSMDVVLSVAAAALLWRVAWLCGGWRETNGAGVERGCCILWSNEEEEEWLAALKDHIEPHVWFW